MVKTGGFLLTNKPYCEVWYDNLTFEQMLIEYRYREGVTKKDFVKFLGVKYNAYVNWEGRGILPRVDVALSICKKLDVDINLLKFD